MKLLLVPKGMAAVRSLFVSLLIGVSTPAITYTGSETVVQVGNRVITGYDLEVEKLRVIGLFESQGRKVPSASGLTYMAVDELVKKQLVLAEADRLGMRVSDRQIESMLRQVAAQNNISISQLPSAVRSQGLDYDNYLATMRDQVIISQMRDRIITRAASAEEEEIEQYLRANPQLGSSETRYSFWLATVTPTPANQQNLPQLLEELSEYEQAFNEGNLPETNGRVDTRKGEDVSARRIPSQIADTLSQLEPGEVSSRFRSELGYHVAKLIRTDRQDKTLTQNRYAQILILKQNHASLEKARSVAETALAQLQSGTPFDVIAARYSDDPAARENSGDLGWMVAEQFPQSIRSLVEGLSVGEISDIAETGFGYHIIEVSEQRSLAERDALRESARLRVITEKQNKAFSEWVDELMKNTYIQVIDTDLGGIYP